MLINRPKIGENIWAPPTKPAEAPWADYRNLDQYIDKASNDKWGVLKFDPDAAPGADPLGRLQAGRRGCCSGRMASR